MDVVRRGDGNHFKFFLAVIFLLDMVIADHLQFTMFNAIFLASS